jgi:hypothetical protein
MNVPLHTIECGTPRSQQENANEAWRRLGEKLGFDYMTVRPNGKGDRFFSAEVTPCKGMEIEAALAAPATAPEQKSCQCLEPCMSCFEREKKPATAPAQPEIVDLLAEMYELILANKVVLAEKSGGVWTWPDRAIEAVRKHRSGPARAQADHKKSV